MRARSTPLFPDYRRQLCQRTEVGLIFSRAESTQRRICQSGTQIVVGKDPVARRSQARRQRTQECHQFIKPDLFVGGPPLRLSDSMDRQVLIASLFGRIV